MVAMNNELRDWTKAIIKGWNVPSESKRLVTTYLSLLNNSAFCFMIDDLIDHEMEFRTTKLDKL